VGNNDAVRAAEVRARAAAAERHVTVARDAEAVRDDRKATVVATRDAAREVLASAGAAPATREAAIRAASVVAFKEVATRDVYRWVAASVALWADSPLVARPWGGVTLEVDCARLKHSTVQHHTATTVRAGQS